jgi:hypothetical protein
MEGERGRLNPREGIILGRSLSWRAGSGRGPVALVCELRVSFYTRCILRRHATQGPLCHQHNLASRCPDPTFQRPTARAKLGDKVSRAALHLPKVN